MKSEALILATTILFASPVAAQVRPETERPELPEIPGEEPSEPILETPGVAPAPSAPSDSADPGSAPEAAPPSPPERILPPVPPVPETERDRLGAVPRVRVERFRFSGNTVFDDATLEALVGGYTGRELTAEEVHAARDVVTRHYVGAGYVNSGAVLPDQRVAGGTVEMQIVEGTLTDVRIEGNSWLSERYLASRVERHARGVLNVTDLELGLRLLQRNSRVGSVQARLGPGGAPGEAVLRLGVDENRPVHLRVEGSNYEAPSIGAWRGRFELWHESLTRNGDTLRLTWRQTEGLQDLDVEYRYPVRADDTTVLVGYRRGHADVVESPFDAIDIESKSRTYRVGIERPFYRSLRSDLVLGVEAEVHRTQTYLLGERFSFGPGVDRGKAEVAVFRFRQDWVFRDRNQVIAARSQLTVGTGWFGANTADASTPDSRFVAWLAQLQWARRFDRWWGTELLFRLDGQVTSSPLLSLEQFAIGGHASVRGYRENQLVRDNAVVASIEARIPVWWHVDGRPIVQLVPFFDWGYGTNEGRATPDVKTLYSAGIGFRWSIRPGLVFQAHWAEDLRELPVLTERDVQDTGFHLALTWQVF